MSETLPQAFIDRLKELVPPSEFDVVLNTFSKKRPSTFRTNTLKTTDEALTTSLTNLGFEIDKSTIPNAFVLKNKTQRELTETVEYKEGHFYIQGLSSMIPPLLLDVTDNDLVLDMCSAPGSKTTQIASLMHNHGSIIANDMSRVRLYKLAANIKTLGVTNTRTFHTRAQELWRKFPETFDKVLVDVPCSLEGRFLVDSPKTYANWSFKKIKTLSEHQKHILRSAVSSAKSGATIVYSTCTLAPEENEEVIDWILSKCPEVSLEKTDVPYTKTIPGITEWNGTKYNPNVEKCVRIMPNELFEGFFVAKLKKS